MTAQPSSSRNEINEYLNSVPENVKDPLKWWWDNRKTYPELSRMAMDYHSIPGEQINTPYSSIVIELYR